MIAIAVYVENLVQHGDILLQMKWRPMVRPLVMTSYRLKYIVLQLTMLD